LGTSSALLIGCLITLAQNYPSDVTALLDKVIAAKLSFRTQGRVGSWFEIVVSGVLANWLVGMAAFFATMGRTIFGKYIPVFLAVTLFVAANFQHSPANMAYLSLAQWMGHGPGWGVALGWNIIPAGIGNLIGGTFFVALPLWYGLRLRASRPTR
jgi:formate transporter